MKLNNLNTISDANFNLGVAPQDPLIASINQPPIIAPVLMAESVPQSVDPVANDYGFQPLPMTEDSTLSLQAQQAQQYQLNSLGMFMAGMSAPMLFAGGAEAPEVPVSEGAGLEPVSLSIADPNEGVGTAVPDTATETITQPSFTPYRSEWGLDFETQTTQTPNGTSITVQSNQTVAADGSIVDQGSTEFPANQLRATFDSQTGNLNIDWLGANPQQSGLAGC